MKKSVNKVLIIVLIVVSVLAMIGGIFAYLFLATDIFKSDQQLFLKSLMRNYNEINEIVPINSIEKIEEKLQQSKYEENITIDINQSGKDKSTGRITVNTQNDYINKKTYSDISLSAEGLEKDLQLEYMRESNLYSLRFTNSVKQFLSVENKSLKQLAVNMGLDEETIEKVPDTVEIEKFSLANLKFTQEEINSEISKYGNMIYNNVSKDNYTNNKNVVITVNGKTITTNSYVLTLTSQDVKELTIKILKELQQDEIILTKLNTIDEVISQYIEQSIKSNFIEEIQNKIEDLNNENSTDGEKLVVTIYEESGHTVRVKLERGTDTITFDTIYNNEQAQLILTATSLDQDNVQISNILTITKESDTKGNIQFLNINGEEQKNYKINFELVENENNINLNVTILSSDLEIKFTRQVNFVNEIEYKATLDNSNNIILNDLAEAQMSYIFSAVGDKITTDYIKKIQTLDFIKRWKSDKESDVDVEKFNSKFQIYEGTQVSTEKINELVKVVFTHNQQQLSVNSHYVIVSGEVVLKVDETDYPKLNNNGYYNVECKKDQETGLITEILITVFENENETSNDVNNADSSNNTESGNNALDSLNTSN